jgi:TrmH family RNA methyltransferase
MIIESVQNASIKQLAKLKTKKERDLTGTFLAEGFHLVQEADNAGLIEKVYQLAGSEPFLPDAQTIFCSQPVLNKLSSQQSDAKIIALCKKPEFEKKEYRRILMLERIQDPGNAGTLIRSAYAFGADLVCLSAGCADPYSAKTLQSTQGAVFQIPVISTDLFEEIERCKEKEVPVIAAALHQNSIALSGLQIPEKYALLIGNEGSGLSQEILDASDIIVHIEMSSFESLNAAVAGSILLYALQPETDTQ